MRTALLHLAFACVTGSMAFPSAKKINNNPEPIEFVELFREPASQKSNHSLVYFGYPNGANASHSAPIDLQKRTCSAYSDPTCNTDNAARNDICENLVTELNGDAGVQISQHGRQICYEGDAAEKNKYCCVSWGTNVSPLTKGDFVGYTTKVVSQCTENGVSGKFNSVLLGSSQECVEICMSNRGTHC
ncbi:hypothetical protein EV356DRAFT_111689 [Viridothelium virens]|uniref:WD-like domain-containing protein n=1 Tax=Viridothelium virens TaxID=1048519 RepID=A0A6A6HBQ4_VIRVR|nr:hypothetical protein EV356DRAFT_111689 [Viridothelium virens]